MQNRKNPWEMKIQFGKYSGKTYAWVRDNDPAYLVWVLKKPLSYKKSQTNRKCWFDWLAQYEDAKSSYECEVMAIDYSDLT